MSQLLKIENLTIGYKHRRKYQVVCKELNADLYKGELVCLLGANGKGKSTLLKTIGKFINPLGGSVSISNKDIKNVPENEMSKNISVVLTDKLQVPNATVEELVSYGRSPYTGFMGQLSKTDWDFVNQAMEQCDIAHKAKYLVSSLSDGERQKASIAKALAQDTPIILLDEPTAFLDLPSRVEIMKLLRQLAMTSGKAVLMSTHDLDLALQMADKLWLMNSGNLITGSPEDLLYQNAFQTIFNKNSISFDNRTGMFKVEYESSGQLAVKGHGFEYVLLRRAFARQGIDLVKYDNTPGVWVNLDVKAKEPFQLCLGLESVTAFASVESLVKEYLIRAN